eukprot:TRINITY_DN6811_c0_g5_i1.p1 TRINITY_DN6811_c0_g5~~TRINITY_DN6811_c0_g5_i1.p1  ORF type:complete len:409 (+),score=55.72 TRINITY_DN6811_c0_g5_i1:62-1288(+)
MLMTCQNFLLSNTDNYYYKSELFQGPIQQVLISAKLIIGMQAILRNAGSFSLARNRSHTQTCTRYAISGKRLKEGWKVYSLQGSTELYDETGLKQLEAMKKKFTAADLDGNGVIDREELRALLESTESGNVYLTTRWILDEDVEEIMNAYDVDSSGDISFDEFVKLCEDGILLEGTLQEYEDAFKSADASSNGKLGATELARLFQNLGEPLTYEELVKVMMKYDKDESGQIEFEEFLRMFRDKALKLDDMLDYIKMVPKQSSQDGGTLVQPIPRKHQVSHPGQVMMIFSEEELNELLADGADKLAVIFAGLTWCRPCKAIQRPYQKLAEAYNDVKFIKFYGNANDDTKNLFKNRLKVRASPSFFFIRNGEIVSSHTGANKTKLETNLRKALNKEELVPNKIFDKSAAD